MTWRTTYFKRENDDKSSKDIEEFHQFSFEWEPWIQVLYGSQNQSL